MESNHLFIALLVAGVLILGGSYLYFSRQGETCQSKQKCTKDFCEINKDPCENNVCQVE